MTQENENLKKENPAEAPVKEASADFKFLIAEKVGMTQVYTSEGELKGVTVLKAGPCKVAYLRTSENDGYNAVCLGFGHGKEKNLSSALKGVFAKNNLKPLKHLKEVRVEKTDGFEPGQTVSVAGRFNDGDWIDVQGITIGKGFAGGMKRHNFRGQPASHGASDRERAPGGLASRRSLGRVLPGQRMAGHLGSERVTVHKMQIVKVLADKNLILVNGGVPGKEGSIVYLLKTVKKVPKPVVAQAKSKTKKEAAKAPAKKK
ncbi:MAG: 50S ribosomal protein L3 [Elusimicrobiota bacterium]